jgi:hypothetical protein
VLTSPQFGQGFVVEAAASGPGAPGAAPDWDGLEGFDCAGLDPDPLDPDALGPGPLDPGPLPAAGVADWSMGAPHTSQ